MIDALLAPFRRKRAKKLYFALAIADKPTDGFKFTPDSDCKVFIFTGDATPGSVIPASTLRAAADKFEEVKELEGQLVVSEKTQ